MTDSMYVALSLEWIGATDDKLLSTGIGRYLGGKAIRKPWVAEIVGSSERFGGFDRVFLRPDATDWSEANSEGSRGVIRRYTLSTGLYEIRSFLSWRREDRYFAIVQDGKLARIDRDEALQRSRMLDEIHEVPT